MTKMIKTTNELIPGKLYRITDKARPESFCCIMMFIRIHPANGYNDFIKCDKTMKHHRFDNPTVSYYSFEELD